MQAQQEEGPNKAVHIMFLTGGLILFFVLNWTGNGSEGYFVRHPNDFSSTACRRARAVVGHRALPQRRGLHAGHEIASELKKVTWPTRKETQLGTIVVIVMVIVLGDHPRRLRLLWVAVTEPIYG
jgi:hypothetical protein